MNKLLKIYEEVTNECDGCQYFDMDSLNDYVEYEKPLYALIAKKRIGELEYISPKQYIYNIARGFGGLTYDDALIAHNHELAIKYSEDMKNGDKFPIGYYSDSGGGQEGRHRAMAAMRLGVNKIPVMRMKEITYDRAIAYAKQYKGMSFKRLDDLYKHNGYKGITNLGYNDLQRFIQYNT